ncbi:hypothetical protein [Parabacteroides sp. AM58-2XD]|uniref:hypothetical protein n=1 Tax=Parabacteroides sp. AM58-2XD TaxID=2292362 RepID=UPI000FE26CC1|nr:hypothetical protein [Parabacteroides sp. AM58-2XD]
MVFMFYFNCYYSYFRYYFSLERKVIKVQGYICLATPHPAFAVASELASLKQRMLRTLTPAAALYARQLMPF